MHDPYYTKLRNNFDTYNDQTKLFFLSQHSKMTLSLNEAVCHSVCDVKCEALCAAAQPTRCCTRKQIDIISVDSLQFVIMILLLLCVFLQVNALYGVSLTALKTMSLYIRCIFMAILQLKRPSQIFIISIVLMQKRYL